MVIHKNFDHKGLESDIKKLSVEIAEKKNLAEHKNLSDKELVKAALRPTIKQAAIQQQVFQPQTQNIQSAVLPDYLKDSPADIKLQVEKFIDLAFHQGIEKAAKAASQSSTFILDAFHDALTDKLYEELKQRKLI